MPKIVDYDKRKQEIAQKAIQVFVEKGFTNTNLSDIASLCGMGRTTLYQYFDNKDTLFNFALDSAIERLESQFQIIATEEDIPYIERIRKIINQLIGEFENNQIVIALAEYYLTNRNEDKEQFDILRKKAYFLRVIYRDLFSKAIKAQEINRDDPSALAYAFYGMGESAILHLTLGELQLKQQLEVINRLIDGLKK